MEELKRLRNKNKSRVVYHGAEIDSDKSISPLIKYEGVVTIFFESNDLFDEINLNKETAICFIENITELINKIK